MSEVAFLNGRTVLEVQVGPDGDSRIIFEVERNQEPALYADVGWCVYEDVDGTPRPLLTLPGSVVRSTSTEGGVLIISFADGSTLTGKPNDAVEGWEVVGGDPEHLVVCMPGGGEIAVFDSRDARLCDLDSSLDVSGDTRDVIEQLTELANLPDNRIQRDDA